MRASRVSLWRLLIAFLSVLFAACESEKEEPTHPQAAFASHEEAVRYIRGHYNRETVIPDDPSIRRMEFYPAQGRGYLILYFHTDPLKGWLFQSVPVPVWEDFKRAPSKVRFYHERIGKGPANRYAFELRSR